MRVCGIEGCETRAQGRGLCNRHYQKWYRGEDIPAFQVEHNGNKQSEIVMGHISTFDLAWLVGLFEGEGYFGYDRTQVVVLGMTDEDIILKAKAIIEKVLQTDKPIHLIVTNWRDNELPMFTIRLYGAKARATMRLIVRYMGNRRRAIIWKSLNGYTQKRGKIDLASLGLIKCA